MVAYLLSFVIAAPGGIKLVRPLDLYTAPGVPPLSKGLPDPRDAPENGTWKDLDGATRYSGTFLPAPLDREIFQRLGLLEGFPDYVQVHLVELVKLERQKCDGRVAVTDAANIAERVRAGPQITEGWNTWFLVGAILLGAAVAGGAVAISYEVRK